jgi:hypothetical protein
MKRWRLAIVVAAVVTGSLALGASAAARSGAAVLIQGTVTDGSGHPVPNAAVFVFESQAASDSETQAGATTTDANGNYAVTVIDSPALQAQAAANGGYNNFDMTVSSPTYTATSSFSATFTNSAWVPGDAPTAQTSIRLKAGEPGVTHTAKTSLQSYKRAFGIASGLTPNVSACGQWTTVLATAYGVWTTVGEVHTANDARETFTYGQTADSNIDVGYSTDNSVFSINGSVHIGNSHTSSDTISVGASTGRRVDEEFTYQHQKISNCAATWYQKVATSWQSGIRLGTDNSNLDYNCPVVGNGPYTSDYGANSGHHTSSETMVHFSGAASVFGMSLGAQSGWGTYVDSGWAFGSVANHYLCGSTSGVADAPRIYAGLR